MTADCRRRRLTPHERLVVGVDLDSDTRCAHYHTDRDVIAIRFACCGTYYPCFQCHAACADHPADQWPRDQFQRAAVLCGVCGTELSVRSYLDADHECPSCEAAFNPGCRNHADRYFAVESAD